MKILVIDDAPHNVASAHKTLGGYDYIVVDNVKEAYELLEGGEKFDVVLTDLWLPRGEFTGEMFGEVDAKDTPVPAGLVFAIKAANDGAKVVICTDSDHHKDRLCSLLDLIRSNVSQRIHYVEARNCPVEGYWENNKIVLSKDWYRKPGPLLKNWFQAMEHAGLVQ